MPYRAPDAANPRVQRTRDRMLAAARELLAEAGPAGLTYSVLAERAGVTRQTLYRHWPTRSSLLVALILEGGSADGYPEAGDGPAAVAAAWLTSLRDALRDQARRAAVVAVAAQSDADPDSAQALTELAADRRDALNDLLKPSGAQISPDEYPLLYGPVLARIIFERAEADDDFIASVVAQWLAGRQADSAGQG
jgi:AcrR family transcriptional regulator